MTGTGVRPGSDGCAVPRAGPCTCGAGAGAGAGAWPPNVGVAARASGTGPPPGFTDWPPWKPRLNIVFMALFYPESGRAFKFNLTGYFPKKT